MEADEDNNAALVYFAVMEKRNLPIIIEFDVFKFVKSPVCGTLGLQYAKRYLLNSPLEINKVHKEITKSGLKYINKISKFDVPDVINIDIDNGKYLSKETIQNNMENLD